MSTPQQNPTNDLLHSLATADVLDTFQRLPLEEQDKFLAWIEKAPDEEAYWRRIGILVLGMRMAPLSKVERKTLRERPDFWTLPNP